MTAPARDHAPRATGDRPDAHRADPDRARRAERPDPDRARRAEAHTAIAEAHAAGGQPLPTPFARAAAPTLGDLADVRVHVGPASARAAAQLEARAFTVGRDVHFAAGAYQPGTAAGLALLDHELTHAAQPLAPAAARASAPWLAADTAPAEREASRPARHAGRPTTPRDAEIHRFPEVGGLTEHETVPPPFLMQVLGGRFLVALEVGAESGTAGASSREVKIAVQVQGDEPLEATEGLSNRELRILATTATRPVNASIARLREHDVAIDLYGDGLTVISFEIELRPDARGRTFDYHMTASDLGRPPSHGAVVRVILPELPLEAHGAAGGDAASTVLPLGGDNIRFIARRFRRDAVAISAVAMPASTDPTAIAVWVFDDLDPTAAISLIPSQTTGMDLWFDVDGGGADIRLVHRMADWVSPVGYERGRAHYFDAFDPYGVRIHDRAMVIAPDQPDAPARPPIPPDQLYDPAAASAPSAYDAIEEILPDQASTPGETYVADVRPDGTITLRVDGDGDRYAELLVLFRRVGECDSDGNQPVEVHLKQLSTHESRWVTVTMTPEQAAALAPSIDDVTDGHRPTVIDLIPSAFDFRVPAAPIRMTISPAFEENGERTHNVVIGSSHFYFTLPAEPLRGGPLARDVAEVRRVGEVWFTEVTLGEYGDRFRLVFQVVDGNPFVSISGMSRQPGRPSLPTETRRVALQWGILNAAPTHVVCNTLDLRFALGEHTLIIRDAISAPTERDPMSHRVHELTVSGSAVLAERSLRYDVTPDGFVQSDWRREAFDDRMPGFERGVDTYFDGMASAGRFASTALRGSLDEGGTTQAFYDAVRELHMAMLHLRRQVWEERLGHPADVDGAHGRAVAAAGAVPRADGARVPENFWPFARALISRTWPDQYAAYPGGNVPSSAFDRYIRMMDALIGLVQRVANADELDREAAASAAAIDTLVERGRSDATPAGLLFEIDASIASQVVTAHRQGLITAALFDPWNRIRLNMPSLRTLADLEASTGTCEPDGGRIGQTMADAEALAVAIEAALTAANEADPSGTDAANAAAAPIAPAARLFRSYVQSHEWDHASTAFTSLMTSFDGWITNRVGARYGATSEELRYNRHLHNLRGAIATRHAAHPDAMVIGATFAPDTSYYGINGGISTIPLTVMVWREDGDWVIHDLTPETPFTKSVDDNGELEPPHALFAELNDNDRFPKGLLHYQIPGGSGGRVRCTAEKEWHEWLRDFGLIAAAIGLGLVTFGTGTVVVVGSYFLAGAAIMNAVAAGGELHDSVTSGQATTLSVTLNILDIIASLAGAGALISGTITRGAVTAARAGMAWTGAAARVAAFADKVYIPMTALSTAGDVATVAVMSYDAHRQLEEMEARGATPEQIEEARKGLLVQLAITGGLTAMAVRGDLPEIRAGRRNIVLDVVGDVAIARAAGVQLGGIDIDVPVGSERAHAAARWHADDIASGRVDLGDDADGFHEWHRRWLALERRIDFHPGGTGYDVRLPVDVDGVPPPQSVVDRLNAMALPGTALHDAERAFAYADDIAAVQAAGAGLRVDPLDARWPDTRRALIERLGDTPDTHAMLRRFEQARLGSLGDNAPTYLAARRNVEQVIPPHEVDRVAAMFPGSEVYIRGGLADPSATIDPALARIEIDVVVPHGTPPDQIAAIEQRGQLLQLRPDPDFLQTNGLDANRTLGVNVRVTTPDSFAGFAMTGPPMLRIDSPLATRRVELAQALDRHLLARGAAEGLPPVRVEVVSDEDFARQFGSEHRGRAVFRVIDGQPVIFARVNATPADMLDEASHLTQLRDPDMARRIRMLDDANFHDWPTMSVQTRIDLYRTKLEVEIDAKHRTIAQLQAESPVPQVELDEVTRQLDDLTALQREVEGITPRQLSQLNAGAIAMPSYLEHPPWMFGRLSSVTGGPRPNRFRVEPSTPRTPVPRTGPEVSTLSAPRSGNTDIRQIGNAWSERTLVSSDVAGEVVSVTPVRGGDTVVTVRRDGGGEVTYRFERGATIDVHGPTPAGSGTPAAAGSRVEPGMRLGEDARDYRLVEWTDANGVRQTREEIRRLPPAEGWVQRGSESTFRGAVMESAALRQLEVDADARIAAGTISGRVRIPHSRGGGGFDHVFVEFTGSGASTTATIRIIEVKDYPGSYVPLEEFTAIRGSGLAENMQILRNEARAARDAARVARPSPASFAGITDPHQLNAIDAALRRGSGRVHVEVMIGPTTMLGAAGAAGDTTRVMSRLRDDVNAQLGSGTFVTNPDGTATTVLQTHVTTATADETARRAAASGTP